MGKLFLNACQLSDRPPEVPRGCFKIKVSDYYFINIIQWHIPGSEVQKSVIRAGLAKLSCLPKKVNGKSDQIK